jgi:hypothetical protein
VTPEISGSRLGWWVSGVGDVNGDGAPDFAAGCPFYGTSPAHGGRVVVYSGSDASEIYPFNGPFEGQGTGSAICGVGDVDGDGAADFAIGSFQRVTREPGFVELYSGQSGSVLDTYAGEQRNSEFGISLCGSLDANGDGVRDLMVGAVGYDTLGYNVGRVYIYLLGDADHDGHMLPADNCPAVQNVFQDDYDGDGGGDLCDPCPQYVTPGNIHLYAGDANEDSAITAADIIYMVNYTFKSGPAPLPMAEVGDVNCDLSLTAADIIYLVNFTFKSGPAPCDVCALPGPAVASAVIDPSMRARRLETLQ